MRSPVDDAELIRRIPGDAEATEELFRRHWKVVTAYAARRCYQPADVADVVAATFLTMLEAGGTYRPGVGGFRPWLLGIAHHQVLALQRRENRQQSVAEHAAGQRVLSDDAMTRLEERIAAAQSSVEVEHAMAGLRHEHREALRLVGGDGLTPQEAAVVVGISAGAFRLRLLRARQAMRSALTDPLSCHLPIIPQEVRP